MNDERSIEDIREDRHEELQEQEEEPKEEFKRQASQYLTSEAQSRLENVRTARPEQASMIERQIAMIGQSNRVNGKIDDSQLKEMLKDLNDKDSDYSIKYR